ncbi:MAG: ferrous iron transporter B [Candidatus Jordarchaeaceae archaeon]
MPKFRKRWGQGRAEAWGLRRAKLFSKSRGQEGEDRSIKIYLAGNPNVGKSVIFNKLTGINVIVSNYPGTTVEVTQGTLEVDGHKVVFKDLPGIYSLGATSKDQEVAVRAILEEKPDVIINVVNAFNLERNLNLTLQLLELNVPVVIALNQVDFAARRGILVDAKKLEDILGVPVIPTVAIHGKNIRKLLETALLEATIEHKREHMYHHHGLHHLHEHLHDVHHFHKEGTPLQLINEKMNHKQETEIPEARFFRGFGRRRRRGILERAEISEMQGEGQIELKGESEGEVPRGGMGLGFPHRHRFSDIGYSLDVERLIRRLEARITREIPTEELASARVVAKWLLEGDWKAAELAIKGELSPSLRNFVSKLRREIEWRFGEKPETRISKERYALAGEIAKKVTLEKSVKPSFRDRLDSITLSYYTGIPFLLMVVVGIFALLFFGGGFLEGVITSFFEDVVTPFVNNVLGYTYFDLYTQFLYEAVSPEYGLFLQLWLPQVYPYPFLVKNLVIDGAVLGVQAVLAIAFPYILTFYIVLALLEDTGYLARIAFLLDNVMHRFGLHGKSIIPLLASLGCNVPALMGTRILESRKQRLIASFLIVLIPCSARTSVILGSVAYYIGIQYALMVYSIILGVVVISGLVLSRILPGTSQGLVMEMPPYQVPSLSAVLQKTWIRLREFLYLALPLIIVGSVALGALSFLGFLDAVIQPMAPFMANWLGLPSITSVTLFYGLLRKEMTIQTLLVISQLKLGITDLGLLLTPTQMVVYAVVVSLYFPCLAAFVMLSREMGLKYAIMVSLTTILLALFLGGVIWHTYLLLNPLSLDPIWLYFINFLSSISLG